MVCPIYGFSHYYLFDALALATGAGFCGQCHRVWLYLFSHSRFFLATSHYKIEQICANLGAASPIACMSASIQPYRLPRCADIPRDKLAGGGIDRGRWDKH